MIDAGYVDVRERMFKLPMGPWSSNKKMKEIGSWNLFFFLRDTEGFCIYLLGKIMGVSKLSIVPVSVESGVSVADRGKTRNSGSMRMYWPGSTRSARR